MNTTGNYSLSCCSTADMASEFYVRRNIIYTCFHYKMDGIDYPDDCGKTMPFDVFYKRIANGSMPTTSQVNAAQYMELFEPVLNSDRDIIHVCLSSGITGTYNSACFARDELAPKYPGRKIYIVDSLAASSGYGLLMDMAADIRDGGASIDELYSWLEENKLNINHWFFSSDLTHFKRGGRISAAEATFGTILKICPLMNVDHEGRLTPRKKVRGRNRVIAETAGIMADLAQGGLDYSGKCFISHANCYEDARLLADLLEDKFKKLNGAVVINSVGAVIGAHTGPGTVALFFYGSKRVN